MNFLLDTLYSFAEVDSDSFKCKVKLLSKSALNQFNDLHLPILAFESTECFPAECEAFVGTPGAVPRHAGVLKEFGLEFEGAEKWEGGERRLGEKGDGRFSGMKLEEAREAILEEAKDKGIGGHLKG